MMKTQYRQQNYQNREEIHANINAERALLSGLLIGSTKISDINLSVPDFYDSFNRDVFKAAVEVDNDGKAVDIVSIAEKIGQENFNLLAEILNMPDGLIHFRQYEKSIAELSIERKRHSLVNDFRAGKINDLDLIGKLEELNELADNGPDENIFYSNEYTAKDIEKFKTNDEYVFGMKIQYPAICLIVGATSTGKTEYMLEIADSFTKQENHLSLFCEYEGTKEDMCLRLAKKKINNHNLIIMIDRPFYKIKNFVSKNADKKILIIIDYLQMFARELQAKDEKTIESIRYYTNKIYQNFKSLKNTYKNVCVCFLSNLNNQGIRELTKEQEINPLTVLTAIKEDGNIAYDMDYAYALLFGDDRNKWFLSRFALKENKERKYMMLSRIKPERHGLPVLNRIYTFNSESGRYEMIIVDDLEKSNKKIINIKQGADINHDDPKEWI